MIPTYKSITGNIIANSEAKVMTVIGRTLERKLVIEKKVLVQSLDQMAVQESESKFARRSWGKSI